MSREKTLHRPRGGKDDGVIVSSRAPVQVGFLRSLLTPNANRLLLHLAQVRCSVLLWDTHRLQSDSSLRSPTRRTFDVSPRPTRSLPAPSTASHNGRKHLELERHDASLA